MDSSAPINLTPIATAQITSSDAAMPSAEEPSLDFAAMLALGLAPDSLAPESPADQTMEFGLPATDTEDPAIATATDTAQLDPGALLLPDRLSVPPQSAAQGLPLLANLMNPQVPATKDTVPAATFAADAAADDGYAAAAMASPGRAAKFAAGDAWLPPSPAEAAGAARTAFADLLPATTSSGSGATVPDVAMTGWSAQPTAITHPGSAPVTHRVDVPFSQPGWSDAFSSRVVWLAGQHQQSAELHVNPPELGPIDIMLSFDRDQAHIHFSSAHLPVREAIETALSSLRDALGQAGIQLGNTSVSAEGFGRPDEFPGRGPGQRAGAGAEGATHAVLPDRPATARIGLVDTFA